VTLTSFCIDRTEVTVAAYQACSDSGACRRASSKVTWPKIKPDAIKRYSPLCNVGKAGRQDHPINCVTWKMADRYCREQGKRLPTEAEWEFAARGPDGRRYPWGDDPPSSADLNACGSECVAWGEEKRREAQGPL
jgi:formylglycine-generating enzyme required for sulfatase activity